MPVLNDADEIYVGDLTADAVYVGDILVWEPPVSGFNPSDLTGLAVWLDAADYLSDSWPNRAAGGAATVIKGSPAPVQSATTLNGLPVVRFTVDQGRVRIMSGSGVDKDWTVVYVARMVGPYFGRIVDGIYPPNNIVVGFWNGFQDVMYDNGFTVPNPQTAWTTDWKMYSGDGTGTTSHLYSNGTLLGTVSTAGGFGGTFSISGYGGETTEESCDCEVAEVVMYNRCLTDVERQQVENYLYVKWFAAPPEPEFVPIDVPDLMLWLDASQIIGWDEGQGIIWWPNLSDTGGGAATSVGTPVYRQDGINGHPAIRFGEFGFAEMTIEHDGRTIGDRTIFQVLKVTDPQFGSFHTSQLQFFDPYMQTYSTGGVIHTYTNPDLSSGVAWSGNGQLVTLWCDSTANTQGLEVDGLQVTSGWTPSASSGKFLLGANAAGSYGMNGFIGEILIYDRCLTFSERDDVLNYLRTKWDLP